jgi:exonuclease SbcD
LHYKFVHAADLHLDTPFRGLTKADEAVGKELMNASLKAFDSLISLTISSNAAFIVFSGDIYDKSDRGVRAQLHFLAGMRRLEEKGIRAFIVHGNHDPLNGWSAVREWPTNVTVFGSGDVVSCETVERPEGVLASVHGTSYPQSDVKENLALRFKRGSRNGLHIGVLHCNVGNNSDHAAYSPCTVDDLIAAGIDYWALGHIHKRQNLRERDPWIVYPGNLQGRSTKPSEMGEKGAVVVDVIDGHAGTVEFFALDSVRFIELEFCVDRCSDLGELEQGLREEIDCLREKNGGRGLIVRATLTGRTTLHSKLAGSNEVGDLLTHLNDDAFMFSPFVWWESLRDRTLPNIDLEQIRARGSFSSELLTYADRLKADPEVLLNTLSDLKPGIKIGSMLRHLTQLDPDEARAILEDARLLAVSKLEEGDE